MIQINFCVSFPGERLPLLPITADNFRIANSNAGSFRRRGARPRRAGRSSYCLGVYPYNKTLGNQICSCLAHSASFDLQGCYGSRWSAFIMVLGERSGVNVQMMPQGSLALKGWMTLPAARDHVCGRRCTDFEISKPVNIS